MQNKKAVNTLYHVFTAFFMRQIIFKNTHIQLVEAMHDPLILRIFKISAVRHHAESAFFEATKFQKMTMHNLQYTIHFHNISGFLLCAAQSVR